MHLYLEKVQKEIEEYAKKARGMALNRSDVKDMHNLLAIECYLHTRHDYINKPLVESYASNANHISHPAKSYT